ncbi:MAG TPA: pyrroloquinoline quinone biosynthesis protein PqqB [Solirubrobacteraceae bacterium]|nr:pyrroloquinoline quinone biosynthesis protein PqqB [Solirubrobacteraceae bacterium]
MLVRILGAAAGGGFPQWNCRCETCEAARGGERARPRSQSSLAIRGSAGPWFLVNASPDARQQLEGLHDASAGGLRDAPIAGVLLTDAEIDHTAGLLLLRESATPIRLYGDDGVQMALRDGFPVLTVLERYCGLRWTTLRRGEATELEGSSLVVESFASGGDAPRYLVGSGVELQASGLQFRDRDDDAIVTYVPGMARLTDGIRDRFSASDLVLVDGTFWTDDELPRLGYTQRGAHDMGHLPLSGADGTIEALRALTRPRKVLVHINNTNPILLEDSAERAAVADAGIEVGYDGMEVAL